MQYVNAAFDFLENCLSKKGKKGKYVVAESYFGVE